MKWIQISRIDFVALAFLPAMIHSTFAQRQKETLGRGTVAVRQRDGNAFVGWRLLSTDSADAAFNLYRSAGEGEPARLNAKAWSTLLLGGGIRGGQVFGCTDKHGREVTDRHILGIDYKKEITTPNGRPIRIVDKNEQPIDALS